MGRGAAVRKGAAAMLGLAALWALPAACGIDRGEGEPEHVGEASQAIHSSHAGSPPWTHVLTCYGGCEAPHYDPSACNHNTSCGPIANGKWWYATERAAFYCGAKLKLERGGKCVVVDVQDNGPADWVEDKALAKCGTPYIIDTSPLVADYFGGGCGWGECFLVSVTPVPANTPTGPAGCQTCECQPGEAQQAGCGNCGVRTRTCGGNCKWGGWSSCNGQGPCAPGTKQTEACCDCGQKTRSCNGSCQWGGWSGCAGPDPLGGCDTGEPGPCAAGTVRCVNGCKACVRDYEPVPEVCDAVDNDCSGDTDDGFPAEMGDPPPDFAARLVDLSYPRRLAAGSVGTAWATFVNEGKAGWDRRDIWLAAASAGSLAESPLFDAASWSAWDVATVLDGGVAPQERATFAWQVRAPAAEGTVARETFRLEDPSGEAMRCPLPELELAIHVTRAGAADPSPAAPPVTAESGCGVAATGSAGLDGRWYAPWWLLGIAVAARRRTVGPRSPHRQEDKT